MKRDLDLCLQILREFEDLPPGKIHHYTGDLDDPLPPGYVDHIDLLIDAGMIDGEAYPAAAENGGGTYLVHKITWAGHDF